MLKGYSTIAHVDLTTGNISYDTIDEDTARKYIGGVGWSAKTIWDETTRDTDPLSPENPLIFMTGPLTGSVMPKSSRYIVAGLSFGLLISTISKTQQEAFMSMFLFVVPAIILSGFFYPIDSMPSVFQWLTLLNPVRHFLEIVRAIFLKGSGIADLWPQYLALTLLAAAALWLAIVRFGRSMTS